MTSHPIEEDEAFAFLLGELPEAEAEALEASMFDDDERFRELSAYEDELVDAYVGGALIGARRERFEARLLPDERIRSKVATARALAVVAQRTAPSWWSRAKAYFTLPRAGLGLMAAAAATALVLLVALPSGSVEVSLFPSGLRSAGEAPRVALRGAETLELELALDDLTARTDWTVVVTSAGREVWRGAPATSDAVAVRVAVPAAVLAPGRHVVSLHDATGEVASYEMRVEEE